MNNIIRIFILIFAMSVLSGQVLAQSVSNDEINYIIKNEIWSATRTLDKQIRAAQKAGNKAEVIKLKKLKKTVLAKRKIIMATPELNQKINAAIANYNNIIKAKKALLAKRKIIMATNKIDQEIDSTTKLWGPDCIDQSRDSAKIIYSTLWEQQIQVKCKKLVKRKELLLKNKSSIISKRMTQYKIKPFTSGEKFSITYTSKLLTPELDKEILLVNASYKKLKKTRQKLKHKRMDENNIKSKCPFPMILVSQKCRQEG